MKLSSRVADILTLVLTVAAVAATGAAGAKAYAGTSGFGAPNAEKMDIETHSFLIEKLETVIGSTSKGDATRVPSLLRLADLYSERARLISMKEFEEGCKQNCNAGDTDRAKAISTYEVALDESKGQVRRETESRILFQLAYLYEINGKDKKAEALYTRILRMGSGHFSSQILGQSEAGLGEVSFKRKQFKFAKEHFSKALLRKETPRQGWIGYRIAWCDLNLGAAGAGKERLIQILKTPSLLTMESTRGAQVDVSFQEDVARDLTLFFVRTGFTDRDVETLIQLTPAVARKAILVNLAEEAERLGQKRQAISVWSMLIESKAAVLETPEKLEASARIAYMLYSLGDFQRAVSEFDRGLAIWKKQGCEPDAECALLQKRFRKLVIDWNKNEETKPTAALLSAYSSYVSTFPHDAEMAYWGANVARELKNHRAAVGLYRQAAERSGANNPKIFEASLVAEIEMAEATADGKVRQEAYQHYLALNPGGEREFQVRYQLAHLAYKRGENETAAESFYGLAAKHKSCLAEKRESLCKTAADLALDSLVLLKRDELLEARALEFSNLYRADVGAKAEYRAIARRARLNLAAATAEKETAPAELNDGIKKLKQMDLAGATQRELVLSYQNRFVLAEKAKNFAEAEAAIAQQISVPGLSRAEREEAKAKQLWIYEMQLKFADAYRTARSMAFPRLTDEKRELKLSMLAELSGADARPHLRRYLEVTRDRAGELSARVNLLKLSGFSVAEWNKQARYLRRDLQQNSKIVAAAALEVFSRHGAKAVRDQVLSDRRTRVTADGLHLLRSRERRSVESFLAGIPGRLPVSGNSQLAQKSIQSRVQWLRRADKFANSVIQLGDPWLEAGVLNVVARENRRLFDEIVNLPLPAGLNAEQERTYKKLIAAKSHPFIAKAQKIEAKIHIFAGSERLIQNYEDDLNLARDARREMLISEAKLLARMLPDAIAKRLDQAATKDLSPVKLTAIQSAIQDVRENPFDLNSVRELRSLEEKRGQETMVAYLETRIRNLEGLKR